MNLSLCLELLVASWISVPDHVVCIMEMLQPAKMREQGTVMVPSSEYFHSDQYPLASHGVAS